jgi:hypothetical protein
VPLHTVKTVCARFLKNWVIVFYMKVILQGTTIGGGSGNPDGVDAEQALSSRMNIISGIYDAFRIGIDSLPGGQCARLFGDQRLGLDIPHPVM